MTPTRRQARELSVQMLTAADMNPPEDIEKFIADSWEILISENEEVSKIFKQKGLREFTEERVKGVLKELVKIDEYLEPLLANWHLYRLGTVERAVLRMGIWELSWTDVPKAVVINEAVDLANWFSSSKSRRIVNGVLDKHAGSIKRENDQ